MFFKGDQWGGGYLFIDPLHHGVQIRFQHRRHRDYLVNHNTIEGIVHPWWAFLQPINSWSELFKIFKGLGVKRTVRKQWTPWQGLGHPFKKYLSSTATAKSAINTLKQSCIRRWFVWLMFGYIYQKSHDWIFFQRGAFQKTACPKKGWTCPG